MSTNLQVHKNIEKIFFTNYYQNGEYVIQINSNEINKYKETKEIPSRIFEYRLYQLLISKISNEERKFVILTENFLKSPSDPDFYINIQEYSKKLILIPRVILNHWTLTIIENMYYANIFRREYERNYANNNNKSPSIRFILSEEHKDASEAINKSTIKLFLNSLCSIMGYLENNGIINKNSHINYNKLIECLKKNIFFDYFAEISYYDSQTNSGDFLIDFINGMISSKTEIEFIYKFFFKNNINITINTQYFEYDKARLREQNKGKKYSYTKNCEKNTENLCISSSSTMLPISTEKKRVLSLPQKKSKTLTNLKNLHSKKNLKLTDRDLTFDSASLNEKKNKNYILPQNIAKSNSNNNFLYGINSRIEQNNYNNLLFSPNEFNSTGVKDFVSSQERVLNNLFESYNDNLCDKNLYKSNKDSKYNEFDRIDREQNKLIDSNFNDPSFENKNGYITISSEKEQNSGDNLRLLIENCSNPKDRLRQLNQFSLKINSDKINNYKNVFWNKLPAPCKTYGLGRGFVDNLLKEKPNINKFKNNKQKTNKGNY